MYTRPDMLGFLTFLMVEALGLYGIISMNYFAIFFWHMEYDINNRIISFIPLTKLGTFLFLVVNSMGYLAVIAHLRSAFCDPGVIDNSLKPPSIMPKEEIKGGSRCKIPWKPMRAHHGKAGDACIFKMDHHGPWTNNCVGIKNAKYFMIFLVYSAIGGLLGIGLMFSSIYFYGYDYEKDYEAMPYLKVQAGLAIYTLFGSFCFPFFTIPMIYDHIENFQDNRTYIDELKEIEGAPYGFIKALKVNGGEDWGYWWIPTKPILNVDYCERLYTLDEIYSRKFRKYPRIDYDPQNKLKAAEIRRSNKDKIIFFIGTTMFVGLFCYTFSAIFT